MATWFSRDRGVLITVDQRQIHGPEAHFALVSLSFGGLDRLVNSTRQAPVISPGGRSTDARTPASLAVGSGRAAVCGTFTVVTVGRCHRLVVAAAFHIRLVAWLLQVLVPPSSL
jgi:hypothetical protein